MPWDEDITYPNSKNVVRELLRANPQGLTANEMVDLAGGRLTKGSLQVFLDQMVESGEVRRVSPNSGVSYLRRVYWRYVLA